MTICDLPTYECHSTMPYFFVIEAEAGQTPSGVTCLGTASEPPRAALQPPATPITMQSAKPEIVLARFMEAGLSSYRARTSDGGRARDPR
jgi:hypothetical protein